MNIIEIIKNIVPALALMAVCSAAILYLPQLNRDDGSPPNAASGSQQKAPAVVQQERDKQA